MQIDLQCELEQVCNDEIGLGPTVNIILVDGTVIRKEDRPSDGQRRWQEGMAVVVVKPKARIHPAKTGLTRCGIAITGQVHVSIRQWVRAAGLKIASPDLEGVLRRKHALCRIRPGSYVERFIRAYRVNPEMFRSVFVDTMSNLGSWSSANTIGIFA